MYQLKVLCFTTLDEPYRLLLRNWILSRIMLHGKFFAELIELGTINLKFSDSEDISSTNQNTGGPGERIADADALIVVCDQASLSNDWPFLNLISPSLNLSQKAIGILTCAPNTTNTDLAVQRLTDKLRGLGAVVINNGIYLPYFDPRLTYPQPVNKNALNNSIRLLLDHMIWWTEGLKLVKTC